MSVIKRTVTKQVIEDADVLCDRCGRSLYNEHGGGNLCGIHTVLFGNYDSPVFVDGDEYEFAACEACLLEWFATFKNNPFQPRCTCWPDGVCAKHGTSPP